MCACFPCWPKKRAGAARISLDDDLGNSNMSISSENLKQEVRSLELRLQQAEQVASKAQVDKENCQRQLNQEKEARERAETALAVERRQNKGQASGI